MVTFLAGTITDNNLMSEGSITNKNGFSWELSRYWKKNSRMLYICSDPSDYVGNDGTFLYYRDSFIRSAFSFSCFDLLDYRYAKDFTFERLSSYDVIILGSGRVPRQNHFFIELSLHDFFNRTLFHGIVIGISAGALNCAKETYNWPEEPGDTYVPYHEKFYQGLGLSKSQVLPHFQARHDMYVDGRHLYSDITIKDSYNHEFLAIPDYSYVVCKNGYEEVYGPHAYYRNGFFYDTFVERQAA